MTEKHFGFRVGGITPEKPYTFTTDLFELRQAAIECTRMLDAAGWTEIVCAAIGKDDDGQPTCGPIDFKVVA